MMMPGMPMFAPATAAAAAAAAAMHPGQGFVPMVVQAGGQPHHLRPVGLGGAKAGQSAALKVKRPRGRPRKERSTTFGRATTVQRRLAPKMF